ncbi:MAG: hypothetical protein FJX02_12935 [Alphaproteobacteria bacterium]|nr:hypothetical protein [Alphaproteobacteria bacterium]
MSRNRWLLGLVLVVVGSLGSLEFWYRTGMVEDAERGDALYIAAIVFDLVRADAPELADGLAACLVEERGRRSIERTLLRSRCGLPVAVARSEPTCGLWARITRSCLVVAVAGSWVDQFGGASALEKKLHERGCGIVRGGGGDEFFDLLRGRGPDGRLNLTPRWGPIEDRLCDGLTVVKVIVLDMEHHF